MFSNKLDWGLNNALSLFGALLVASVLLQFSPLPLAPLAVSFTILAAYYLGKDIRKQHTEYQQIMSLEQTNSSYSNVFNLVLAGLLLFGIFNVLGPYYSSTSAYTLFNFSQFLSVWVQTGFLFHIKFWFDLVFLIVFAKEFITLFFRDIITFRSTKKSHEETLDEPRERIIRHKAKQAELPDFDTEETIVDKSGYKVKRVKVLYEDDE